jgi:hypothetical protein
LAAPTGEQMTHGGGGLDGVVQTGAGSTSGLRWCSAPPRRGWHRLPALRGPVDTAPEACTVAAAHAVGQLPAGDQPEYLMAEMDVVARRDR